ncbi:MFS transporter [Plantactinospora sp. BB1]|uniref:MFS transporter n=1 Tax=Plantactinospora sp. BB1 TaxID=2071627 RepID=UPI000D15FE54|nr:MFS transporter [Plantactinospora sp. BB1]AVT37195.1 MFS transporter [Plantactinospora sp. BB1]
MTEHTLEAAETAGERQPISAAVAARARWAVTAVFFVNGLLMTSYIARLPGLKTEHRLSDGELGLVLTVYGVAAVLTMQLVGVFVARFGSVRVIRLTLVGLPVALVGVGLAGGAVQLGLAVLVLGTVIGVLDVSMNAHAVAVERVRGRPIMNGCHAAWSLSAATGSLVAAGFTRAGVSPTGHFLAVGAVCLVAGLLITAWLLPPSADHVPRSPDRKRVRPGWRAGWTRTLLLFGAMGFVTMVAEATVISWSGVFLHDYHDATLALAPLGLTAFTACQTAGRLVGDRLHVRYGAPALFRAGGVLAVCGLAVVLLVPSPTAAIAGFGLLGLGGSVLLPLVFSAVGHAGGDGPGAATFLSRFSTFTYAGILIGPALVGWSAELVGLGWTLAGLVPLLVGVVLNARLIAFADRDRRAPATG